MSRATKSIIFTAIILGFGILFLLFGPAGESREQPGPAGTKGAASATPSPKPSPAKGEKNRVAGPSDFKQGDVIFQTSLSPQSKAIRLATHSEWSHVGIIVKRNGGLYVYEAHGPVGFRSFDSFIASGEGGKYMVRRYKKPLTAGNLKRLEAAGKAFAGKPYDIYFGWGDSEIYCSELVWKIFDRGLGVKVGKRQKLRDFDLSHPLVKQKLRERYGDNVPLDETVISPKAIADSPELETIFRN